MGGASVGLAVLAAAAFANAANPTPPSTGTVAPGAGGAVTVTVNGTWSWGELAGVKTSPQNDCAGRSGVGWSVDWWGLSNSPTATTIPGLTGSIVLPTTSSTQRPVDTTGALTPDGSWKTPSGQYFHTSSDFNGFDSNLCAHTDANGAPIGTWSSTATYPNEASVPSKLCVNFYDPHGKQNDYSTSASDNHATLDKDNSIVTNDFDPAQTTFCFAPTFTHPVAITVDKTNNANGDATFTKTETASTAGQSVQFQVVVKNTSQTATETIDAPITDAYNGTTINVCDGSTNATVTADTDITGDTHALAPGASATCTFTIANYAPAAGSLTDTVTVSAHEKGLTNNSTGPVQSTSTVNAPQAATLASKILLCTDGSMVSGGNLSVSGGTTHVNDGQPIPATSVAPGTYTVTATAPAHYALTSCPAHGYNGSPTQTVTLANGDNKELDFYVVALSPNVTVAKDGPATGVLGGNGTYHLVATNGGNDTSAATTVTDTLPTGESFVVAGSDPACSGSGQTVTCTLGALAPNGSKSFTVVVSYSATGDLKDCATVTGSTQTPSCVTTHVGAPKLVIQKTGPATGVPGGRGTYTITVTNNGDADATSASFVDVLPAGETFVSASGATCTAAGTPQQVTCQIPGTIGANGGSAAVSVVVQYAANTGGQTLTDCAKLPDNTQACASTKIETPDVTIAKTGPAVGTAGGTGTYTITVSNSGQAAATGVTFVDALPVGETFVSASGAGVSCAPSAGNPQRVDCSLASDLAAGASVSVQVTVSYGANTGGQTLTDCAQLSATNQSCVDTRIPGNPVLTVVKSNDANGDGVFTDTESATGPGQDVPFTVSITNTSNVPVVIDSITDAYGAVTGANECASLLGTTLAPGDSVTCSFTIAGYSPAAGSSLTDTVTVLGHEAGLVDNTTRGSDTSTVNTPTPPSPGAPDLSIVKSASAAKVTVGDTLTYTLTVSNVGSGATTDAVTVTDTLPTGLSLLSVDGGTAWSCSTSGLSVTCTYLDGAIQPGQTVAGIKLTTRVLSTAPTVLVNTGVVHTLGDNNPTNDRSTVKTPVTQVLGEKIPKTPSTPSTPSLPFTGSNASQLVPVGLVAVLMGFGLLLVGRRRRRHPALG